MVPAKGRYLLQALVDDICELDFAIKGPVEQGIIMIPEASQPLLEIIFVQGSVLVIKNLFSFHLLDTFFGILLHFLHSLVPEHVLDILELLEL